MRTIEWDYRTQDLRVIDQRALPSRLEVVSLRSYSEVAEAIRNMTIRGAPGIGAAAAFGLALAAKESEAVNFEALVEELTLACEVLRSTRPTAVNLSWALNRMMKKTLGADSGFNSAKLKEILLQEAQRIADQDVEINHRMALYGADLIDDGDTIIHHCNTGALAVVDGGTALGAIRTAFEQGKHVHILVDETRPRLQGARLTAWELEQYHIPYEIISDNMAGYFLSTGKVQKVFFGADRIAANGDVVNKIGTYMLSLAAYDNGVPVYSVAPTSTIDISIASGDQIPIEERDPQEVLDIQYHGERIAPENAKARNPAFDVTPNRLISAIVTENGIVWPPFETGLAGVVGFVSKEVSDSDPGV